MKRLFQRKKVEVESDPPAPSNQNTSTNSTPLPLRNNVAKPGSSDVAGTIGYEISRETMDYATILGLCDYISLSSSASKDAARALRKEFKYGNSPIKAVRLMGIMMRNCDVRFKSEIASKRFLDELSNLVTDKKTAPPTVAYILRILSPLAYEYQRDADLSSITHLFNKLKTADMPMNGLPLDPEDDLFTPTGNPRAERPSRIELPSNEGTIAKLREEAEQARINAGILSESLGFAKLNELVENELIKEFYSKCLRSLEVISSNLDWMSVQARKSRENVKPLPISTSPPPNPSHLGSNNPFAPAPVQQAPDTIVQEESVSTEEESVLSQLLLANTEISDALALHASRFRALEEENEFAETKERSKNDTKFDRSTVEIEETTTDRGYQVPTSAPAQNSDSFSQSTARLSMNPYAAYLAKPTSPPSSPPSDKPPRTESNYNFDFLDSYAENPELQTPMVASPSRQFDTATVKEGGAVEESISVPSQPSERALGKMRSASYSILEE